ncbi:MAG: helix-turn-helix transcriptional regulator [Flavobacteriales bacterium]|nr:helix-turn-helix transcriptional regulator [Flavobacteriales bacterium]
MNPKTINEHLDRKYGKTGSATRDKFVEEAQAHIIAEMLKAARKEANLTQQELADRLEVKRTYISKIERAVSDIRLSTLKKIVEQGLGGKLHIHLEL